MKTYKERTREVLKKVDGYTKPDGQTVENGGNTLALKRRKPIILWTAFAAACIALIIAFNLVLFLPFPVAVRDISAYKDSEYYGLISVVNDLTTPKPAYKNNFEKWTAGFKNYVGETNAPDIDFGTSLPPLSPEAPGNKDDSVASPDGSGNSSNNGNYNETTNNQVAGVTEGDLLKRSDKYAFYIIPADRQKLNLRVYGLNGAEVPLVSTYDIGAGNNSLFDYSCEMYLSEDCNTVTVIAYLYDRNVAQTYTCVISLDVSDVNDIKEQARILVSGTYISSRLIDGNLLLFTNYIVSVNPDFSDEKQFLPQAGAPDNLKSLPAENIIYSDNSASARYTVVCAIDQKTLNITSDYAFLDFSNEVYVSESNVFLTHAFFNNERETATGYLQKTEINCLSYADGSLEYKNSATVNGFVLNQYSMDEYDGMLRVVTEVERVKWEASGTWKELLYEGASLYCIDLESFELRASFEEFSPDGEHVYSVRFDKQTAYVCTAVVRYELIDPVFAIDLSDLDNITCKDTGTITGYSLSLTKFKDGTLLGIGYGDWRSKLKIELYRETGDGVESVASFEKSCEFSEEYKAYFINAENGLIGLSVYDYDDGEYKYLLVLFDGYDLKVAESLTLEKWIEHGYTRAALADGYIYVFFENGADVINWNAQ